jgi:hypothetical protein
MAFHYNALHHLGGMLKPQLVVQAVPMVEDSAIQQLISLTEEAQAQ